MLNATLYRYRKIKKPIYIILVILALAFSIFMLIVPSHGLQTTEEASPLFVSGIVGLASIIVFIYGFCSSYCEASFNFSFSDVNFHLAGPFSPKFNLLLSLISEFKSSLLLIWVIVCQSGTLRTFIGFNTTDMLCLIGAMCYAVIISKVMGSVTNVLLYNSEKKKKIVDTLLIIVTVVFLVGIIVCAFFKSNMALTTDFVQYRKLVQVLGYNPCIYTFPVIGWVNTLINGVLTGNLVMIVLGIAIVLAEIALLVIIISNLELDYYEEAIRSAQKHEDIRAAKVGDISAEHLSKNVKIGDISMNSGWGVMSFFAKRRLENKRFSKFSFINRSALVYKVIIVIYSFMFCKSIGNSGVLMFLWMAVFFNSLAFSGGGILKEISRPYLYLIPESSRDKINSLILSVIPEMLFDSIILGVIVRVLFSSVATTSIVIVFAIMMLFVDISSTYLGILLFRLFSSAGKGMIGIVKSFIVMFYSIFVLCTSVIIEVLLFHSISSYLSLFVIVTVITGLLTFISYLGSGKLIDSIEMK